MTKLARHDARKARLAAALRDNLRRRKAAARETPQDTAPNGEEQAADAV